MSTEANPSAEAEKKAAETAKSAVDAAPQGSHHIHSAPASQHVHESRHHHHHDELVIPEDGSWRSLLWGEGSWLTLFVLFALSFGLRYLSARSAAMTMNEMHLVTEMQKPFAFFWQRFWEFAGQEQPLWKCALFSSYVVSGKSLLGMRLLSAFGGALLVPAVFYSVRRTVLLGQAGFACACVAALIPALPGVHQNVEFVSMATALALLSVAPFLRATRNGSHKQGMISLLLAVTSCLVHMYAFAIFPLLLLLSITRPKRVRINEEIRMELWIRLGVAALFAIVFIFYARR